MQILPVILAVLAALSASCSKEGDPAHVAPDPKRIELQQIRNLGKAFYENPATQNLAPDTLHKAVDLNPDSARDHLNYGLALLRAGQMDEGIAAVGKAQEIDPQLPHTYFNLGVEFKKQGETDLAIEQFEGMAELRPDHAKTHYQLGTLYKQKGETELAIAEFEKSVELDPSLSAPHFQMFGLLRRSDPERARKEIGIFKELKAAQADAAVAEDVDWSFYSELYDPIQLLTEPPPAGEVRFETETVAVELAGTAKGLDVLDADGDGNAEVLVWSDEAATLLAQTDGGWQPRESTGLDGFEGLLRVAVGDANNDGFPDLAAVHAGGVDFIAGAADGFAERTKLCEGAFADAAWVDFDHDYDLDLLAVGQDQVLLRNNGDGTYLDVSDKFPFKKGPARAATWLELEEDNGNDIVIAYSDELVVFEDRKLSMFAPHAVEAFDVGSGAARLDVFDLNHDGFLDGVLTTESGSRVAENHEGDLGAGSELPRMLAVGDSSNRGWSDVLGGDGLALNSGGFEFESSEALPGSFTAGGAADFDGDGLTDFVTLSSDGKLAIQRNRTETRNGSLTVAVEGVKNQKRAEGTRIEVKAGLLYGKQVYRGLPLVFGIGSSETVETVRITWPNGLIQNESEQPAGAHRYIEKPRLSGSCPMIFTWNGEEFEFISDVLGVAPLGAGLGDGQFFPTDHDEYVWVDGESLMPRDGFYEVRVTEELREVSYLDQIQLVALDHPADTEVYTNEKFVSPPFPEFRLFGVKERIYATSATNAKGRDVLDELSRRDRRYSEGFERDFAGRAETQTLTLDFESLSSQDEAVLFLHGWVDWADGSTFVGTAQSASNMLMPPRLEVRDATGEWVTAIEDMGIPAGKPKTIAVDLTGLFPSDSREVRITTNLCVYWDEVFAAIGTGAPRTRLTRLDAAEASLGFRGFSAVKLHPERKQPEQFIYADVQSTSMWNPTPGYYTNYGDVRELLGAIDDHFVIMGSGDEVTLRFAAEALPELPEGWTRDYLLFFDGWAKDGDSNTAYSSVVEPLPFHGMSGYPYRADEGYPDDTLHRDYLDKYNRRPALRLLRGLINP
jgi:tetratricopeptide (TPR) repeat protein